MRARRWAPGLLAAVTAFLALCAPAAAEVVQKGDVRVRFEGAMTPRTLPRTGAAPIEVSVGSRITALKHSDPPRLRRISIAINGAARFSPGSLPVCTVGEIQPSTTRNALAACGASLVGTGAFAARILLPQEAAFPAGGRLYAFAGRYRGRPAILAHVYGTDPVPTSFTLPFEITTRRGRLGTVLTASLAEATGRAGYITALSLRIDGSAGHGPTPYLGAGCPAPKGFGGATFPFARASFGFGTTNVVSTLTRSCRARG